MKHTMSRQSYARVALGVDIVHSLTILFWFAGFAFPIATFPMLRLVHSVYGIASALVLLALGGMCPTTTLSHFLHERADPTLVGRPYEPFVSGLVQKIGIRLPKGLDTTITALGTAWMIIALYGILTGGTR